MQYDSRFTQYSFEMEELRKNLQHPNPLSTLRYPSICGDRAKDNLTRGVMKLRESHSGGDFYQSPEYKSAITEIVNA